jgi:hypothetical protein
LQIQMMSTKLSFNEAPQKCCGYAWMMYTLCLFSLSSLSSLFSLFNLFNLFSWLCEFARRWSSNRFLNVQNWWNSDLHANLVFSSRNWSDKIWYANSVRELPLLDRDTFQNPWSIESFPLKFMIQNATANRNIDAKCKI